MLVLGLAVVGAIALSPLYAAKVRVPPGATSLGVRLVVAALLLSVPVSVWSDGRVLVRDAFFLAALALLFVGALLIVGGRGDDDPGAEEAEPPWWPSFEQELDLYTRRRRPRAPSLPRR